MAKPTLNPRVLDRSKVRVIRVQAALVRRADFFLAGGTGLGLRLGHRFSNDLDWFTARRFSAAELKEKLHELPEKPSKIEQQGPQTLRAYYGTLETSFIAYAQVPAKPEKVTVAGAEIPLADLEVMAAMKAAAAHDRGSKRDLIDIHAISSQPGWSVSRFISHAAQLLPLQPEQVARSLIYFADADKEPMPAGCKVSWAKVKGDLAKGVRQWEGAHDRDPKR
jgi:hypothetical protein